MTDHTESPTLERTPPQDLLAERAVLGAMLCAKEAIPEVLGSGLKGGEYYRPAHETIHDTIIDLYAAGEPADPITVADDLEKAGQLVRCGGPVYLHGLIVGCPTPGSAEWYAQIIREKARKRRLVVALYQGLQEIDSGQGDTAGTIEAIQDRILEAAGMPDAESASGLLPIGALFPAALEDIEAVQLGIGPAGVPTGFADLDALTGGLHPGQMVIVAGRPGQGKSTFGLDVARCAAINHQMGVAFFSLEMSCTDILKRLISAEGRIAHHHLQTKGALTPEDRERMGRTVARITSSPLYLDDSPDLTLTSIRTKARQMASEQDLKLIVIDYMQLLRSGGGQRYESRQQEVSEISRSVKLLAKELKLPVIALSQLNRGPEQRTDRRPVASDLRESGALEQDSDLILLLHRPDSYEPEHERAGEADFIVAKNRSGPTSTITTAFQGHYSRFVDMAQG